MAMTVYFILFFWLSAAYGAYDGTRELRKMRAARSDAGALLSWSESPVSGPRTEGLSWIVAMIHWSGTTAIALATFAAAVNRAELGVNAANIPGSPSRFLYGLILALGVSILAFFWGRTLLFPLGNPFAGPTHFQLMPDGIVYAGRLFPWRVYSYFTVDSPEGPLKLWSAFSPQTLIFALRPQTLEERQKLRDEVARFVPAPGSASRVSTRPVWAYPAAMTVFSLTGVAVSLLMYRYLGLAAFFGNAILGFLYTTTGGRLMMYFIFGGQARKLKPEEPRPGPSAEP